MKIAVIGANGRSGGLLVKEAVSRGHDVTAIVRTENKSEAQKVLKKDLFDLNYQDLEDFDVIIDAFAVWKEEEMPLHHKHILHLILLLKGKKNRLLVVGGAGSLYIDNQHNMRLMDAPDFPKEHKSVAAATASVLEELRQYSDVKWTYLCPAADFVFEEPRTGKYKLGGEELIVNSQGQSRIGYADYAVAMIDEAEKAQHIQQRFCVVSE